MFYAGSILPLWHTPNVKDPAFLKAREHIFSSETPSKHLGMWIRTVQLKNTALKKLVFWQCVCKSAAKLGECGNLFFELAFCNESVMNRIFLHGIKKANFRTVG